MTTSHGMLPFSAVKLGVGRGRALATDPEQGPEGVERVETAIEAKRKFVQVGLKVLRTDAVVTAAKPGFQVAEYQVDDGQVFLGNLGIAAFSRRDVLVPASPQLVVAAPPVRHDDGLGIDGTLHKPYEALGPTGRDHGQPQPSRDPSAPALLDAFLGLPLADFDSRRDERLVVDALALATGCPADPGFVHFDVTTLEADPVSVRADHPRPQLVEDLERRLVPAKPKLSLKLRGGHSRRVAGDKVRRPEPRREGCPRPLHDRVSRQGNVPTALAAPQHTGTVSEAERLSRGRTMRASKAMLPPDFLKIGRTRRVVREQALESRQRLGERQVSVLEDVGGHLLDPHFAAASSTIGFMPFERAPIGSITPANRLLGFIINDVRTRLCIKAPSAANGVPHVVGVLRDFHNSVLPHVGTVHTLAVERVILGGDGRLLVMDSLKRTRRNFVGVGAGFLQNDRNPAMALSANLDGAGCPWAFGKKQRQGFGRGDRGLGEPFRKKGGRRLQVVSHFISLPERLTNDCNTTSSYCGCQADRHGLDI